MRIISCHLENFASYKELDFSFENQGLTLINGATGSGKSTLADAIPWVLFGTTAKDGSVDEIRSWDSEEPTLGRIQVDLNGKYLVIRRIRGNSKENDLCYFESPTGEAVRGRDLNDTQKLINNLLGIDSALYLSGAYFHEFSQTAQFFTTTAKSRRAICEQLVDLSLAKTLQLDLSEKRKLLVRKEQEYSNTLSILNDRLSRAGKLEQYKKLADGFEDNRQEKLYDLTVEINKLIIKPENYYTGELKQIIKAQKELEHLGICSECGSRKHSNKLMELQKLRSKVEHMQLGNNNKIANLRGFEKAQKSLLEADNKYSELAKEIEQDLISIESSINTAAQQLNAVQLQISDIDQLLETVADLRSVSITNTIQQIEDKTNRLLSEHFDAEIKVIFSVESADKLDVTILKDGNSCSYTQLSKGQRCLLKLCFGVAVMKAVANQQGTSFNCLFFDEALSGLDDILKVQALGLFRSLAAEHSSVFVIDHNSEFKTMFENSLSVKLVNGWSEIE